MNAFPPLHGPNRWIGAPSPDDQETVQLRENPAGLAETMHARAADNGHDTATIESEPFLRREAGGWHVLALSVVVLGMIIGAPVAYSAMTPTTTASNATPAVIPSTSPLPVAPPPSPAPGRDGVNGASTTGPAGPQGPAGVTTVVYVPVAATTASATARPLSTKPVYLVNRHPGPCPAAGGTTDMAVNNLGYSQYGQGSVREGRSINRDHPDYGWRPMTAKQACAYANGTPIPQLSLAEAQKLNNEWLANRP